MNQRPFGMNPANCVSATHLSKRRFESILELAKKLETDPDKAGRIEAFECRPCYYNQRIGGATITNRACGCCGEDQRYSSTSTDALCKFCAIEHELCKHCGGDIHMRTLRKKPWPSK